jgi:hypothetical protein
MLITNEPLTSCMDIDHKHDPRSCATHVYTLKVTNTVIMQNTEDISDILYAMGFCTNGYYEHKWIINQIIINS